MSKQVVIISMNYNNKARVLYYFYLNLFCRKSRSHFGGRRAIPTACGGRSTIGVVVAFLFVHSVLSLMFIPQFVNALPQLQHNTIHIVGPEASKYNNKSKILSWIGTCPG